MEKEKKLKVEVDFYRYKLLCESNGVKEHLETCGFDLELPLHYDTDKKTGNVTFWQ